MRSQEASFRVDRDEPLVGLRDETFSKPTTWRCSGWLLPLAKARPTSSRSAACSARAAPGPAVAGAGGGREAGHQGPEAGPAAPAGTDVQVPEVDGLQAAAAASRSATICDRRAVFPFPRRLL
jgi:hypothetical protein